MYSSGELNMNKNNLDKKLQYITIKEKMVAESGFWRYTYNIKIISQRKYLNM